MTNLNRRIAVVSAALAASLPFIATPTRAEPPIDKPVRIVVGFPAGGPTDLLARLLAEQLRGSYASVVLVDNRPGAAGRIGIQAVKSGPADGTQILMTPVSLMTIYPHVYRKLGYDVMTDFTPVSSVASVNFGFGVSSAVPASVKTIGEFVTWAKANPKEANFGSPAAGATPHFVGEMLARNTGAPLNHVPFKGSSPLINDLLGGQIQAASVVLPDLVQHVSSGRIRILGVTSAKRSRYLPNVPTFAEGGVKDMVVGEYFGVFVPAKTPAPLVARLNAAIGQALKSKALVEGLEKLSFEIEGGSQAEFARIVKSELDRWGPVVKSTGFSLDE